MIYLETGSVDPYYNLAFEEYVLKNRRDDDYLILWQNDNTIVIGQNQNAEEEINRAFADAHGIKVARRGTGGGAVYHDLGNLNYSFITGASVMGHQDLSAFTAPIVDALNELGLEAEASGRNDIVVKGHKVSGTAQRIIRDRMLFHGCLLFSSSLEKIAGALNADPDKFSSKSAKSVKSRVANISQLLEKQGLCMSLPQFWDHLRNSIGRGGIERGHLTDLELAEVRKLRDTKYATWEWNFGRSPAYDKKNRRRFEGGTVEVRLSAAGGTIGNIVFYGDFLSKRPLGPLTEALRGCRLESGAVLKVLEEFKTEEYFGAVSPDEIAELIVY